MRKFLSIVLAIVCVTAFAGCGDLKHKLADHDDDICDECGKVKDRHNVEVWMLNYNDDGEIDPEGDWELCKYCANDKFGTNWK